MLTFGLQLDRFLQERVHDDRRKQQGSVRRMDGDAEVDGPKRQRWSTVRDSFALTVSAKSSSDIPGEEISKWPFSDFMVTAFLFP